MSSPTDGETEARESTQPEPIIDLVSASPHLAKAPVCPPLCPVFCIPRPRACALLPLSLPLVPHPQIPPSWDHGQRQQVLRLLKLCKAQWAPTAHQVLVFVWCWMGVGRDRGQECCPWKLALPSPVARLRWTSTLPAPPVCRPLGQAQPGPPIPRCHSHLYLCPFYPSTLERQVPTDHLPPPPHHQEKCMPMGGLDTSLPC